MVSLKRNWISKTLNVSSTACDGSEAPCVIIHSFDFSHNHMLMIRHIFFPFYFIPNRFHTFTESIQKKKISFNFNTVVVVPKALFLKWNFMSVIVAFHSITGWRRLKRKQGKEKEKVRLKCDDGRKNCGFELWGIFLPLQALAFCVRNFYEKKRVAIFALFFKHFYLSREKYFAQKRSSWP